MEQYSSRSVADETDLPEQISIEMKEIQAAIQLIKKTNWDRYKNDFVQKQQVAMKEAEDKIETYEDSHDIIRYNKEYLVDPMEENAKASPYAAKRPLVEPTRDESLNPIRMQYEYLLVDIRNFIDDFVKRYYPPEDHMVYYARSIYLFRKLWVQYASNKIHRDYLSWSEIRKQMKVVIPPEKALRKSLLDTVRRLEDMTRLQAQKYLEEKASAKSKSTKRKSPCMTS